MAHMDFKGRVAVVTGAGSGMGREHALMLASRGARVIVNDVRTEGARETVETIVAAGGTASAEIHDVSIDSARLIQAAVDEYGRLDILINNAGIVRFGLFWEMDPDEWWKVFDISFRGVVETTRHAWPHLIESGTGRLINVSSSGMLGGAYSSAYGAAKAAIWGLGNGLAIEARAVGVQVTTIQPSAWTPMTESSFDDPAVRDALRTKLPASAVAAFVTWLAHQDTRAHGECFQVSGDSAGRTTFAAFPRVRVAATSPEGWADMEETLMHHTKDLTPFRTTGESFRAELVLAEPALDALLPHDPADMAPPQVT
jgi:NAD(P)-dependent dehydrogenase (short-subunit alcohol dehydrogenase family)